MIAPEVSRGWQIDQLRKTTLILPLIFSPAALSDLINFRDGGTGWTALEVLCHLRDYEEIFLQRARVTVEQENGMLPNPDPEALVTERAYNAQNPTQVLTSWKAHRDAFLGYLVALPEEAWSRQATHPKRGLMTLQNQLTLITWHDANHLEQIMRVLAERRNGT